MKNIIIISVLFVVVSSFAGCIPGIKKTEMNSVLGASTNVFSFLPGYKNSKIKRYDFYIEIKEKELRLEELRYDRKVLKLKYDKLQ